MMTDNGITGNINPVEENESFRNKIDAWLSLIRNNLVLWFIIAVVFAVVWLSDISLSDVPDAVWAAVSAVAILGIPSYIVGSKIAAWLRSMHYVNVIEVNANESWLARAYYVPPGIWRDVDVVDGRPYRNDQGVVFVRSLKWSDGALQVEGPWMGELTDIDLMTAEESISANRGRLSYWARVGMSIRAKMPAMSQAMEAGYWSSLSDDTLDNATVNPEQIKSVTQTDVIESIESMEVPDEYAEIEESMNIESNQGGDAE